MGPGKAAGPRNLGGRRALDQRREAEWLPTCITFTDGSKRTAAPSHVPGTRGPAPSVCHLPEPTKATEDVRTQAIAAPMTSLCRGLGRAPTDPAPRVPAGVQDPHGVLHAHGHTARSWMASQRLQSAVRIHQHRADDPDLRILSDLRQPFRHSSWAAECCRIQKTENPAAGKPSPEIVPRAEAQVVLVLYRPYLPGVAMQQVPRPVGGRVVYHDRLEPAGDVLSRNAVQACAEHLARVPRRDDH